MIPNCVNCNEHVKYFFLTYLLKFFFFILLNLFNSFYTSTFKENIQSVYNWQYISSLKLWTDVLCASLNKKQLQTLVYPLIQVS